MAQVIQFDFAKANSGVIDIATVQQSCRKLKAGLIAPLLKRSSRNLPVSTPLNPSRT